MNITYSITEQCVCVCVCVCSDQRNLEEMRGGSSFSNFLMIYHIQQLNGVSEIMDFMRYMAVYFTEFDKLISQSSCFQLQPWGRSQRRGRVERRRGRIKGPR